MAVKFWIWQGTPPRGPEQAVTSAGVVIDPTPERYYEVYVPVPLFFSGRLEGLANAYLPFYLAPAPDDRWVAFNGWDGWFDAVDYLLRNEDAKVAKGALRAVGEAWPTFAALDGKPPDHTSDEVALAAIEEDGARKWGLFTYFGPVPADDDEAFFAAMLEPMERLVRTTMTLASETREGPLAIPDLAASIGSEKDWIDHAAEIGERLNDVNDILGLLFPR